MDAEYDPGHQHFRVTSCLMNHTASSSYPEVLIRAYSVQKFFFRRAPSCGLRRVQIHFAPISFVLYPHQHLTRTCLGSPLNFEPGNSSLKAEQCDTSSRLHSGFCSILPSISDSRFYVLCFPTSGLRVRRIHGTERSRGMSG